ncbi:unnamed protein product (macronuclear) [Paramecium tetraurelia]|uniref:protein-tyrosine-phosphatase n=1 Tax=Paramecium tetraurelia TaxID=5888 RepID=A0DPE1_PARTE|nr:uncharacterized protein GSPATT00019090001 [Paramecium tetraurelia]CAK84908.1 unnamed protein product [Paramecium tetraurelia]|eukprot:XP_001452305.1 hypothetical protein (macronuclear) [Paramecium tetraurelia strain d4-2]
MFQPSPMKQKLIESYKKQMDDITCILDCGHIGSLYLGNIESACDFELLKKLKIKSIISICTSKIPNQISSSMRYYQQIILDDNENANISRHFEICFDFIEKARSVGNVLVHCMAGISRSATIVAAYLMKKHCVSSKEALSQLQRKRWQVYPNEGFIKQLLQYNDELIAKQKGLKNEAKNQNKQEVNIEQIRNPAIFNNLNNQINSHQNEKKQQADEYQKIRKKYVDTKNQQQQKKIMDYQTLQERRMSYHKKDNHEIDLFQQTSKIQRIKSSYQQIGSIEKNPIKNECKF